MGFVSHFTTSLVNILIPAALELGSGPPFLVTTTPCPGSEMMQELPAHVRIAARLGKSGRWEESILCHLTGKWRHRAVKGRLLRMERLAEDAS